MLRIRAKIRDGIFIQKFAACGPKLTVQLLLPAGTILLHARAKLCAARSHRAEMRVFDDNFHFAAEKIDGHSNALGRVADYPRGLSLVDAGGDAYVGVY